MLAAIAQRDVPLPDHIDVFHLHEEAPATEMTGVEAVINHVTLEAARLEALSEQIIEESGPEDERLQAINDRLESLPSGLVRLPFPLWTTRQTPRVPSDPYRSSTIDVPQNQSRSAKEALELAPTATAWRAGRPEPPAEYGADPESGAHLSHIQLKPQKLLPQIGDK